MRATAKPARFGSALAAAVFAGLAGLAGCARERPPPSVNEFLDDRILLEATMVRCAENRSESKYTAECVNAREAANRIEAAQAAERREQLEAQSERKRQALRRAQEAAAEARRRAAEAERLRREAELLGRPPEEDVAADPDAQAGSPGEPAPPPDERGDTAQDSATVGDREEAPPSGDLEAVREELRRRQQEQSGNQGS